MGNHAKKILILIFSIWFNYKFLYHYRPDPC